jgi:hypothetical protein
MLSSTTQQQKTVGMETHNTHFLLTVYILYKRTKFPSNIVFTSQSHTVTYFYDVGSTYAIDQKINHLHNDRVANMYLVLNFVILNNLNNNRLSSIQ